MAFIHCLARLRGRFGTQKLDSNADEEIKPVDVKHKEHREHRCRLQAAPCGLASLVVRVQTIWVAQTAVAKPDSAIYDINGVKVQPKIGPRAEVRDEEQLNGAEDRRQTGGKAF